MRYFRYLVVLLAVALPAAGTAQSVQAPATEPATVFLVLSGPNLTALYHRDGCPMLREGGVSSMALEEAKKRFFQPHSMCILGREELITGDTPPPASTPTSAPSAGGPAAASLVGLTTVEVRAKIGSPSVTSGDTWYYDSPKGTLALEFKNGAVAQARPNDFDLGSLSRPKVSPGSGSYTNVDGQRIQSPTRADSPPAGAMAKCRDGTYSFSTNRRGTCSGHGGVAQWLN